MIKKKVFASWVIFSNFKFKKKSYIGVSLKPMSLVLKSVTEN